MIILLFTVVANIVAWITIVWLKATIFAPSAPSYKVELDRLRNAAEMFTDRDLYPEKYEDKLYIVEKKNKKLILDLERSTDEIMELKHEREKRHTGSYGHIGLCVSRAFDRHGASILGNGYKKDAIITLPSGDRISLDNFLKESIDRLNPRKSNRRRGVR